MVTINSSGKGDYDDYNLYCFSSLVLKQSEEDRVYFWAFWDTCLLLPILDSMHWLLSTVLNEGCCGVRNIITMGTPTDSFQPLFAGNFILPILIFYLK